MVPRIIRIDPFYGCIIPLHTVIISLGMIIKVRVAVLNINFFN